MFKPYLFLAILFFLALAAPAHAQKDLEKPALSQKEEQIDASRTWHFGKVKEGKVLAHKFEFKNKTKGILNIKDVSTSCGCTGSEAKKKKLLPGESTQVTVSFKTKGYSGPTKQFVYVTTDDPAQPLIRFTVEADILKGAD